MEWKDDGKTPGLNVLRVVQLDAAILDQEILHLLESQVKKIFQSFQIKAIRWLPEVNLALRFILWKFTIYKHSASLGQSLFDVKYMSWSENGYLALTPRRKFLLGFLYIGGQWLKERQDYFISLINHHENLTKKISFCLIWLENIWNLASLLNFIVFLNKGIYPSLFDRILCLRHIYNKQQTIKKANFKFMNREILWHGYAEIIFFVLPIINLQKLKNITQRIIGMRPTVSQINRNCFSNGKIKSMCPACDRSPTEPYMGDCGHLFCYICIKSNCLADQDYTCPLCSVKVGQNVIPYKPKN